MVKLSIIIPVYNVEKYLERCIRSVADQDIDANVYEIIVVNDGSPDNSLDLANKIAGDYSNITVISQKNTGLGGARNLGISVAKGEYIWFIDSDDFIENNCLKGLMDRLCATAPDVLAFDFKCTDEHGKIINWINFKFNFNNKESLSGSEFYALNYKDSYIWLYLFKRELFIENDIYFKKRINMQDSEILPRILNHVSTIGFYDKPIYFYVNREDSFINSKNSTTRFKYYMSVIKVSNYLGQFKETLSHTSLMWQTLEKKQQDIYKILFLQFIYSDFDDSQIKEILFELKKNNLYPFKKFNENNYKKKNVYFILKHLLNKFPASGRKSYLKLNRLIKLG